MPTGFISCEHQDEDPDLGINTPYCVCSSSTFLQSIDSAVTPANSCAYTTLPTSTIQVSTSATVTTNTAGCQVCTLYAENVAECNSMPSCTPTSTPTPSGCSPLAAPTSGQFLMVSYYFRDCSVVGETQVCSIPVFENLMALTSDFTCDGVSQNTEIGGSGQGTGGPSQVNLYKPPDTFIYDGLGFCNEWNMTFTKRCDGYVTTQ